MSDVAELLVAIENEICHERASLAQKLLAEAPSIEQTDPALRARRARAELGVDALLGEAAPRAVDERIMLVKQVVQSLGEDDPDGRAQLLHALALLYADKRCEGLAMRAADDARASSPGATFGADALAHVHLRFDRRVPAREALVGATSLRESWRARFTLARIAYVMGDFDAAAAELSHIADEPARRIGLLRWRITLASVHAEHDRQAELLAELLSLTEGGVRHRGDSLRRASALYRAGRVDEATVAYQNVWKADEQDGCGRFARKVLNALERGGGAETIALPRFPSTTQKRNYCGPATLELVLRHLGIAADQESIAATVKLPSSGSPMVRLARYLEAQGLEVRRFEATTSRLRECIRLGLPVILQEEYSTTTHVTVLTGVDERIGLLTVQDPMTHAPSERLIETQELLGALFRNGAMVAFARETTALGDALTAAGVTDAPHIRLLDSCDEEVEEEGKTRRLDSDEVQHRCKQAIALCDDYLLAHLRLTGERLAVARSSGQREHLDVFLESLRALRVRYGQVEQPHQTHARFLSWQGRYQEALIEYEDALRIDPGDSDNAQAIASCEQQLGRSEPATKAYWRALKLDPEHVVATRAFAAHALEQGNLPLAEHLSSCALDMAKDDEFIEHTAARIAQKKGEGALALAHARRAVELCPTWSDARMTLASCLLPHACDEAVAIYHALCKEFSDWALPREKAAQALADAGRFDEAIESLLQGVRVSQSAPSRLLMSGRTIFRSAGRLDDARTFMERVGELRSEPDLMIDLANAFCDDDAFPSALTIMEKLEAMRPDDVTTKASMGRVLLGLGRDEEAVSRLTAAVAQAPRFVFPRRMLVTHLLAVDRAGEALALLDREVVIDTPSLASSRAKALVGHEKYDEARRAVEPRPGAESSEIATFDVLTVYGLSLARGADPLSLLDSLRDESFNSSPLGVLRARLCLALSLARGELKLAERTLDALPRTDWYTISLLCVAGEQRNALRDRLAERLGARADEARKSGGEPDSHEQAILAGSRAAQGDLAAFDALLQEAKSHEVVAPTTRTLGDFRDRELVIRAAERIVALAPDTGVAAFRRASILELKHLDAELETYLVEALARFPRRLGLHELRLAQRLMALRPEACDGAEALLAMDDVWSQTRAMVAMTRLLRGDRDGARRLAKRAYDELVLAGLSIDDNPMVLGAYAASRGDADGLRNAALRPGFYQREGAPLWKKLEELMPSDASSRAT